MADYSKSQIPKTGQLKGEDLRDTLLGDGAVFTLPAGAVNANYMPNYFAEATKLNMWSRYKPIASAELFALSEAQLKSANFGIELSSLTPTYLPSSQSAEKEMFLTTYNRPKANSLYRTHDFRGYKAKATHPIQSLFIGNQSNGKKPVVVTDGSAYTPMYSAVLVFNPQSDIRLDELHYYGKSLGDMYLTLVIGTNMGTLSSSEAKVWQSSKTIGEALTNGDFQIYVEGNTANLLNEGVLISNQNIVFVYLAEKQTSPYSFPTGVSLKFRPNVPGTGSPSIETTFYNDSYAVFGDGGEGGTKPITYFQYTLKWMNGVPPRISGNEYEGYYLYLDFLIIEFAGTTPNAAFRVDIWCVELNKSVGNFEGGISSQSPYTIVDTAITGVFLNHTMIDPQMGDRFQRLTFYTTIVSTTQGVGLSGQELRDTVDVPQW